MDKSLNRKEFMEKQFEKYNIKDNIRISAITPDNFNDVLEDKNPYYCGNPECLLTNKENCKYEYACICSHIKAMQEALKYDDDYFVIIEDDITLPFNINFDKIIEEMPYNTEIYQLMILYANSVDILYNSMYKNNIKYIKYKPILPSTGMYIVSKLGAQKLVNLFVNDNNKYDFTKYNNIKVADILLYISVITYTSTIPFCYPNIELESEIHPDHLNKHIEAINSIKKVLNDCKNNEYIIL